MINKIFKKKSDTMQEETCSKNINWNIPFQKIEHIQEEISPKDLEWKLNELFLTIRPHCGNPKFTEAENDLLYNVLDGTVYGLHSIITLRNQVTSNTRPIEDIICDINKLIDFINMALS